MNDEFRRKNRHKGFGSAFIIHHASFIIPFPSSFCTLHSAFCIFFLVLAVGCSSSTPSLTVVPAETNKPLRANFNLALWLENQAGEDRIVLLNDPIEQPPAGSAGEPLQPLTSPPLRQVLVIDLQWRSSVAANLDTPASENAVLNWYVYGGQGLIQYHGTGFVAVTPRGNGANVSIKNSSLSLMQSAGGLIDPFGKFTIDGSFHAAANPQRIHMVMADLATAQADMLPATEPTTRAVKAGLTRPSVPSVADSFHRITSGHAPHHSFPLYR